MKKIIVPTDFSSASTNAARYAAAFAKTFEATLVLVNVLAPSVVIDDSVLPSVMITQAEILAGNKQLMKEAIQSLSKEFSIEVSGSVNEGFSSEIIPQLAKEHETFLIVMGMKGKGKSHSLFGSTTTTIIRKSPYPVLVIPESGRYTPIENITFASDFDASIEMDRYRVLLTIAEKFNSVIHILNVQKNDNSLTQGEVVGKMKTSIAFSKRKHDFHSISEDNVEEGIEKFIETNSTDMLVMVAHKHSFFERVFGTVHTKAMSYHTKIPLLVLQHK